MHVIVTMVTSTINSESGEVLEICLLPIDSQKFTPFNRYLPLNIKLKHYVHRKSFNLSKYYRLGEPRSEIMSKEQAADDIKKFFKFINPRSEQEEMNFNLVCYNLPYVQDFVRDLLGDSFYFSNFGYSHIDLMTLHTFFKKDRRYTSGFKSLSNCVDNYCRDNMDRCYTLSKVLTKCEGLKVGYIDE